MYISHSSASSSGADPHADEDRDDATAQIQELLRSRRTPAAQKRKAFADLSYSGV